MAFGRIKNLNLCTFRKKVIFSPLDLFVYTDLYYCEYIVVYVNICGYKCLFVYLFKL